MIRNYFRTFVLTSVATFAMACIGGGSALAQQTTNPVPVPVPVPSTIVGTDPVPPPPPHFIALSRARL